LVFQADLRAVDGQDNFERSGFFDGTIFTAMPIPLASSGLRRRRTVRFSALSS
jgi:hypothetical protein